MYGKMGESEVTEIILLICTSAICGQFLVFFHILSSSGFTVGSSCSLMATRWQIFILSSLRPHQLTLEGCNG